MKRKKGRKKGRQSDGNKGKTERQRESKERITGRKKAKERKEGKIKENKERKHTSVSSLHPFIRQNHTCSNNLDMTLAVAEALSPNTLMTLIMYIVVTYVLVTLLSTVLSSKLINMHKGNDRSGLLPLLGTGVGGGGPGRWTLVTFSQSTTEVEGGVQRGTRV